MRSSPQAPSGAHRLLARRVVLTGHVQGVGFRPHVYRLAVARGLTGWVQNRMGAVHALVEGPEEAVSRFLREVVEQAPPLSDPHLSEAVETAPEGGGSFTILESDAGSDVSIFVPADTSVCPDCLREMRDPGDRRYRYPFINCTQCGPRYTLIEAMPYDRANTTMAGFPLCEACRREYEDPSNRRFHAEPVACPDCGPSLRFARQGKTVIAQTEPALAATAAALKAGDIVAVRGIGGYHLVCDARNEASVQRLRQRKHRPDKPFAVLVPEAGVDGLDGVRALARVSARAARALSMPHRPIVLMPRREDAELAASVAPGLGVLGLFLPYSPLHVLLLDAIGGPLVATSANPSGEPVLTTPAEIEERLSGVADAVLHHDRPIARPADDPVLREIAGTVVPLRLGRGNAPVELSLPFALEKNALALGAQMKATVTLAFGNRAVISPHIGEMEAARSLQVLEDVSRSLQSLYGAPAGVLLCDAHPGYTTHRWARNQGLPVVPILHHHAHASALAAEYPDAVGNWLVFTWDGVGMGTDGTLWGGDVLWGRPGNWRRVARFRPFRLTGGDRAGREPWRSAAALCWAVGRDFHNTPDGGEIARRAWDKGINTQETTAAGRIFDAAACLVIGRTHVSFEAQAPMLLETLSEGIEGQATPLPISCGESGLLEVDWAPLLDPLNDRRRSEGERAAGFHASMAQVVPDLARALARQFPFGQIGLTGGVFQNARLVREILNRAVGLEAPLRMHRHVPCNDAGISFGQVVEYAARARGEDG
ncbi:carbamoyltransferase HypF [Aliiruegeria lutimaris]|uniref:Carbamoyltransferase HypF n=1 Tax=Aliiruegeria lutimaris TaxID=571298 RepID=A0A1G8YZ38_9RHOB|nr:carbamoyltransferase HypF [Aliiruegeria lutimaris]SDK07664.1 Hydrogenase maturation protein, carbamoyltransferase HypF [Aliiruegeria lutimaris]